MTNAQAVASDPMLMVLAKWIVDLHEEECGPDLIRAAQWRVLGNIGSAIWGVQVGTAQAMYEVAMPMAATGESTVFGRSDRVAPYWAAYMNSSASPALLDTCRFSETHPGIVVIPAALAAAEMVQASGRALLLGIIVGYELVVRLAKSMRLVHRGFDPSGVVGAMGAAAAAARLLRLDVGQTADALAIAATAGGGLLEAFAAIESGRNQFGRASQAGIWAALLAQRGVKGNHRILEGGALEGVPGFIEAYGAVPADKEKLLQGLGREWALPRVGAKVHDGCRYTNAAADLTLELAQRHLISPNAVRSVHVRTFTAALNVSVRNPVTVSGALFSLEFVVATALLEHDVFNDKFTPARVADPQVRELMAKVSVAADPEFDKVYPDRWPTKVEITLEDGRTVSEASDYPKGEPENALTSEEYTQKFLQLAQGGLEKGRAEEVLAVGSRLWDLGDVTSLTHLCTR